MGINNNRAVGANHDLVTASHLQDSRVNFKVRVKTPLFGNFTHMIIGAKNIMRHERDSRVNSKIRVKFSTHA